MLPDLTDKKYIDLAIEAQADFLITGNLIDFPEKKYGITEIISPRDYINLGSKNVLQMNGTNRG